jgi:Acyl-CoA thioester hydrolase/BAAT N-terminal region
MRRLRWCAGVLLAGSLALAAGCSAGSASTRHVRLDAGPANAPFIVPVHIAVRGLPAGLVTVQAQADDYDGKLWQSAAQFRVGANRTLNLTSATPVSGSYHVADAAGLLWSLLPTFTDNPQTQFYMANAGFTVRLRVLVGGHAQASATLVRSALRTVPSVQTVRRDGFASTLLTPSQARPGAPAVVVISGSEGGEATFTAQALALAGYPALALGYFGEPGLPHDAQLPERPLVAEAVGTPTQRYPHPVRFPGCRAERELVRLRRRPGRRSRRGLAPSAAVPGPARPASPSLVASPSGEATQAAMIDVHFPVL